MPAARTPYQQPLEPRADAPAGQPWHAPRHEPAPVRRTSPPWVEPPQGPRRGLHHMLQLGLFAVVVAGCLAAPVVTALLTFLAVHVVRTVSWTTQSGRERVWFRGRRRWFDTALSVLTSPWYLLVAVGGTSFLVAWALTLAGTGALAGYLAGFSSLGVLAMAGGGLALGCWRGPGARRVRSPVDRALRGLSRSEVGSWAALALLAVLAGTLALTGAGGADWTPLDQAPFGGNPLGGLSLGLPGWLA